MFVLGVDPGLSRCGYGCVEQRGRTQRAVAAGVITTPPSMPLPERLAELDREREAASASVKVVVVVAAVVLVASGVAALLTR